MKKKTVIGIIGEQAGGKGAVANIIRKKYGGSRLTVSNILRRTLDSLYLETTRENLIQLALKLKRGFGDSVLMEAMLKEVEKEDADLIIVDGFRMPGDPDPFKREYGKYFYLIHVTAKQKIRYERSIKRGEKAGEATATFEEFKTNEKKGTENFISKVAKEANFKIINNGSEKELENQVLEIMKQI
jgi:dephospho-CoA kinase